MVPRIWFLSVRWIWDDDKAAFDDSKVSKGVVGRAVTAISPWLY